MYLLCMKVFFLVNEINSFELAFTKYNQKMKEAFTFEWPHGSRAEITHVYNIETDPINVFGFAILISLCGMYLFP